MNLGESIEPSTYPQENADLYFNTILFSGLKINEKATHKAVWEAFALNRRADRTPLNFILLPDNFQPPEKKQKRQSYEWYIPKGILKSNWMNKYLNLVPSLVVLFYDLDWGDQNWSELKNDLVLKIQILKSDLSGRSIRLALVLIQSGISVPGEDSRTAERAQERAATLCNACDLQPKNLFVLPHSDQHLLGYTVRLETALSEIGWSFYLTEAKTVRGHKDFLNKTNHQLLFVRHQFKLGYLNELRNDPQTAIKHYAQCYHNCLELRYTDTNLHEIRIVASIVNYKICRLDFSLNLPRDAIAQFRKHIDLFRARTGPKEFIFEHYAWLSKQYQLFGDVFEEAVRNGLPAVQTQNPGFYYQQAAQYGALRRNTAAQVCKDVTNSPPSSTNLLEGWKDLEFYGQRPWRAGKHSLEPPDPQRETEAISVVQHHEMTIVNHSSLVIPLLSSAISQFKKYRCPRIKRQLMVTMAREYHSHGQDPTKALTLLNHVMWDYRSERWWQLLTAASSLALQCAYATASITQYVGLCLEAMGRRINISNQEKQRVYYNLKRVLACETPEPEPGTTNVSGATEAWSGLLSGTIAPVTIAMTTLVPCLEVRASFEKASVYMNQDIELCIKIRNGFDIALQLTTLSVTTNSTAYNDRLQETQLEKLLLPPKTVSVLNMKFNPLGEDVGKKIKISGVQAQIGGCDGQILVNMQWSGPGNEGVTTYAANTPSYPEFSVLCSDDFDTCVPIAEVEVLPQESHLEIEVEHDSRALVWEWLPVTVTLFNIHSSAIEQLSCTLSLNKEGDSSLQHSTQVCQANDIQSEKVGNTSMTVECPQLTEQEKTSQIFYIRNLTQAPRTFTVKVQYNVVGSTGGNPGTSPCTNEKILKLTPHLPFQVTMETHTLKFSRISRVAADETFLIVPKIKCTSHVPILFNSSSLSLAKEVGGVEDGISYVGGTELKDQEVAVDCFPIHIPVSSLSNQNTKINSGENMNVSTLSGGTAISLGQYVLHWQRVSGGGPSVSVSVGLGSIVVEQWGIWVEAELPPQGKVRTTFTVAYNIYNKGSFTTEVAVNMQVSDAFMFSGPKEIRLRVLPGCQERLTYNLYPLLAGNVQLPKLCLSVDPHTPGQPVESLLARTLPSHIYIMPQAKKKNLDQNLSVGSSGIPTPAAAS
ncbi:unnamed protein product, partial [Meganyctiphanes norvegica]